MVIPFDHRGTVMFAVDVNALSVQAVHAEAAKVGSSRHTFSPCNWSEQ